MFLYKIKQAETNADIFKQIDVETFYEQIPYQSRIIIAFNNVVERGWRKR